MDVLLSKECYFLTPELQNSVTYLQRTSYSFSDEFPQELLEKKEKEKES